MKVAVIGAGTMGTGIAQVFAVHESYEVILCDIEAELAQNGKQRISGSLAKLVSKGKMTQEDMEKALASIVTGTNNAAADGELIIEAAAERIELKKRIFEHLHKTCGREVIFATNTSSLSVAELSTAAKRPVIGMHFFNPASVMKLVEVIFCLDTPLELVERICGIVEEIGKEAVRVMDMPGFIVNRILIPMINEAAGILAEGAATAVDIDKAMKLGANHPIGPLALGDMIGLDVCLHIMEALYSEFCDTKYRPHPYMRKMVRAGLLGRKSGKGFYDYGR